MNEQELFDLWKIQDQKLDESLNINREVIKNMTNNKLNKTIGKLRLPKLTALIIGIPYFLLLGLVTFIAFKAGAVFMVFGFGLIALVTLVLSFACVYHLCLISHIQGTDDVVSVQKKLAELRLSTYNLTRLALLQIPLWSVCWISLDVLQSSPLIYGGINLFIFLTLCYFSYWLYQKLDIKNHQNSKVFKFIFSGRDWDPLVKSSLILEELRQFENYK